LLQEDIFCYLDGARFDAVSKDISKGGIFLRTEKGVAQGSVVALVFRAEQRKSVDAIYLLGEVVRYQKGPPSGIAVEWLRAVTEGGENTLASFLRERLAVVSEVECQSYGARGEKRHIYRFPRDYVHVPTGSKGDAAEAGAPALSQSPPPALHGQGSSYELDIPEEEHVELEGLDDGAVLPRFLNKVRSSRTATDGKAVSGSGAGSAGGGSVGAGPLTELIEVRQTVWPIDVGVKVKHNGKVQRARMIGLGPKATYLMVTEAPDHPERSVPVVMRIRSRKGLVNIRLEGTIINVEVKAPGKVEIDLAIDHVIEGAHSGVFASFVRWLAQRTMHK